MRLPYKDVLKDLISTNIILSPGPFLTTFRGLLLTMPLLLLSGCGPYDCWQLNPYNCSYPATSQSMYYPVTDSSYVDGSYSYGTIMTPDGAAGYYSGNDMYGTITRPNGPTSHMSSVGGYTTIITPGQPPVYIQRY
jgi:hypothetical protein